MDPQHLYYMLGAAAIVAGLLFRAGQRLEKIENMLDNLKDLPERVTKIEAKLETWDRPRRHTHK